MLVRFEGFGLVSDVGSGRGFVAQHVMDAGSYSCCHTNAYNTASSAMAKHPAEQVPRFSLQSPGRVEALLRAYRVDCSTFSGNLNSCFRALEMTRCKKRVLQSRVLVGV